MGKDYTGFHEVGMVGSGSDYLCPVPRAKAGVSTPLVILGMSVLRDDSAQPGGSRKDGEFVGTYELA